MEHSSKKDIHQKMIQDAFNRYANVMNQLINQGKKDIKVVEVKFRRRNQFTDGYEA